jgi:hypothetical protein
MLPQFAVFMRHIAAQFGGFMRHFRHPPGRGVCRFRAPRATQGRSGSLRVGFQPALSTQGAQLATQSHSGWVLQPTLSTQGAHLSNQGRTLSTQGAHRATHGPDPEYSGCTGSLRLGFSAILACSVRAGITQGRAPGPNNALAQCAQGRSVHSLSRPSSWRDQSGQLLVAARARPCP